MPNTLEIKKLPRYTTEHHNGRRFRNIWGAHADSDAEKFDPTSGDIRHKALDVAGWLLRKGLGPNRRGEPAAVKPLSSDELILGANQTRAIWLGHAVVLLQADGLNIITDPVFGDRVSPVKFAGPKRLCPLAIPVEKL